MGFTLSGTAGGAGALPLTLAAHVAAGVTFSESVFHSECLLPVSVLDRIRQEKSAKEVLTLD
jgi:hypothetical protein